MFKTVQICWSISSLPHPFYTFQRNPGGSFKFISNYTTTLTDSRGVIVARRPVEAEVLHVKSYFCTLHFLSWVNQLVASRTPVSMYNLCNHPQHWVVSTWVSKYSTTLFRVLIYCHRYVYMYNGLEPVIKQRDYPLFGHRSATAPLRFVISKGRLESGTHLNAPK